MKRNKNSKDSYKLKALGESLKTFRLQTGLSIEELSVKAKSCPSQVRRLESGAIDPGLLTLEKFTSVLGLSLSEVLESAGL